MKALSALHMTELVAFKSVEDEVKDMSYLFAQAFERNQIRGRESRIRVDRAQKKIAYKTPNGMLFFIDTRHTEHDERSQILCPEGLNDGPPHQTHIYPPQGRVDMPVNTQAYPLVRLLELCDWFSDCFRTYQRNGQFSPTTKQGRQFLAARNLTKPVEEQT